MAIYNREDPRTALPQLEKHLAAQFDAINEQIETMSKKFDGIDPYILNSKQTFADTPPIYFKEYDSGLVTIGASTSASIPASITTPNGYVGYIIRTRIQNSSSGVNESGCCAYNYYFNSATELRASVANRFTSQAKVHVLFTVLWVNKNFVGVL